MFGHCVDYLVLVTLEELQVLRSDVIVREVLSDGDTMLVSVGAGVCVVTTPVSVSV